MRPCSDVPLPDDAAELSCHRGAVGDLGGPCTQLFEVQPGFFRLLLITTTPPVAEKFAEVKKQLSLIPPDAFVVRHTS